MIADLVDIHTNNKIGVPKYFKQSYVNTSSYRRNSSGNGFRYPAKLNQGSVNQIKHRTSYSVGNSPVRCLNKTQDHRQVVYTKYNSRTPVVTRKTEVTTLRGFGSASAGIGVHMRRCHIRQSDQHLMEDCEKAKSYTRKPHKLSEFKSKSNTSD